MPKHAFPGGVFRCVGCALGHIETGGLAGPEAKWEAITEALANVLVLQALANAPGTGATYSGALDKFVKFISGTYNVDRDVIFPSAPGASVPLEYVDTFLGYCTNRTRTSVVVGVMAALRWWHVDKGVASPTTHPSVKSTLKGLRRANAASHLGTAVPKVALPVGVVRHLDVYLVKGARLASARGDGVKARGMLRDRAWILLSAAAALRKSEACALTRADVEVLPDGRVYVFVRKSKTDQMSLGMRVYIPHTTHNGIRAAEALRDHALFLDDAGVPPDGPLFGDWQSPGVFLGTSRAVRAGAARPAAGSLEAIAKPPKPGDALVRRLKLHLTALVAAGTVDIDPAMVAGHSLRRCAANEFRDMCRLQGIPDTQILAYLKAFCRWASDKSVEVYVMQHANAMVHILAGSRGAGALGGPAA